VDPRSFISVIIPALNEEAAIGRVIAAIPDFVGDIVVVDNGSTDATARVARDAGARVVTEPRRGYGAACLAGIGATRNADVVVFMDGDYSDHPEEIARLVEPILRDEADLVVGSRVLGNAERGSLTVPQRFGNALACRLLRLLFGVSYTDLGPFRAVRRRCLDRLEMDDLDYGWTVQMQARAARRGLAACEVAVSYRRRIGRSKISGTIRGVVGAGTKIIATLLREFVAARMRRSTRSEDCLVIMARAPISGRAKTRLVPLLGEQGAARLHRQMVSMTLEAARRLASVRDVEVRVCTTGAAPSVLRREFASPFPCRDQGGGALGSRLRRVAREALDSGAPHVVIVGTDCPLLTDGHLDRAFAALRHFDVVLGPASDGGYYLIGARDMHPLLFEGIPWRGKDVFARTREAAHSLGLRVHTLEPLPDVDVPGDLAAWARSRLVGADETPRLSVVVPARNEEAHLAATLGSILDCDRVEVIVVDGESTDRTAEIARAFGAVVVRSKPSRGGQLNAGAAVARAPFLLFVHADTLLPARYFVTVRSVLGRSGTAAGAFDLRLDGPGFGLRAVELGVRVRSRVFGRPYGDQAPFMSASTFRECGGFPPWASMEDFEILARLRRAGRIRIADAFVLASARRWLEKGVLKTTLRNQWRILCHRTGVRPVDA